MPELVEYICEVCDDAASGPSASLALQGTQTVAVVHYAAAITRHLDKLDEDRTMDILRQMGAVPRVLRHAVVHAKTILSEGIEAAASFVNAVLGTEDYSTHKREYVPSARAPPPPLPNSSAEVEPIDVTVRRPVPPPGAREIAPGRPWRQLMRGPSAGLRRTGGHLRPAFPPRPRRSRHGHQVGAAQTLRGPDPRGGGRGPPAPAAGGRLSNYIYSSETAIAVGVARVSLERRRHDQ